MRVGEISFYIFDNKLYYMIAIELKKNIMNSGKKGIVVYKGKDKRKEFDESVSLKKVNLISNFIGDRTEEVAKILMS